MNLGSLAVKIRSWVISLIILVVLLLGVQFLFPEEAGSLLDPAATLAITVFTFLLALILKINYQNKLFLFDLIAAVFIASFFTFTQGLIAVSLLIMIQKLLKVL